MKNKENKTIKIAAEQDCWTNVFYCDMPPLDREWLVGLDEGYLVHLPFKTFSFNRTITYQFTSYLN